MPAGESNITVLVVDDSPDALWAMTSLIRSMGHDVEVAKDAKAALDRARQTPPDLVFVDIKLPDLNGYELARRLRELPGLDGAQIYALTGIPGDDFRDLSATRQLDGHFAKPIEPGKLEELLASVVLRKRPKT